MAAPKPAPEPSTVGYSGRTLAQKLGLDKPSLHVAVVRPPTAYRDWLSDVWNGLDVTETGSSKTLTDGGPFDVIHLFTYDRSQLDADITGALAAAAAPKGAVWISWPKKTSTLFVDITEDTLREVILPLGWVDVKVSAVSPDWSGLKFLRRKPAKT